MVSLNRKEVEAGVKIPLGIKGTLVVDKEEPLLPPVFCKSKVIKRRKPQNTKDAKLFIQFEVVPSPHSISLGGNHEDCTNTASNDHECDMDEEFDASADYEGILDDYPLSRIKQGGKSVHFAKKSHPKNRLINVHDEMKELKRVRRLKQNWTEQKINKERDLARKGLKRFGLDIYNRRSTGTPKSMSPTYQSLCHKPRPHLVQTDQASVRKHELKENNIPKEHDFLSLLVELQHRELSPEDYELLLLLDDTIAIKTVDSHLLNSIDQVSVDTFGFLGELCSICMESYEADQTVKKLPCKHCFHSKCIDFWLSNSSQKCPLDGLAVFPS